MPSENSIQMLTSESKLMQSPSLIKFSRLSSRELEILKLLVEGRSNPAIATTLHLSPNTVKTHVRSIMNKLGVDCRIQVAVVALRLGLI
ncbi:MAG: response regulator transcription factor [Stenomitos rutilans HA7619-LM2]|nr:response regulator transcription factor [Stenomitos rutilans HA7619-LM2]